MKREATLLARLPPPPPERTGWPWTEETDPAVYEGRADWPRMSIVTPSFNQAQFLEETIRSVLLQNYPNLQYVVIDGGSTDGSVGIIKKYARWIDYWVSEKDRGQSHAIRKGLEHCDGHWFNWLNSDDYLLPGALKGLAEAAIGSPQADVLSGPMMGLWPDGRMERWPALRLGPPLEDAIVNHRTSQPAMFYKKEWARCLAEDLHFAMDYDLWVRLMASRGSAGVVRTATPVAVFRMHPDSKTCAQQSRFEPEERMILRGLCAAAGSSRSFQDVLAPRGLLNAEPVLNHEVHRHVLERVLFGRYLAGDLRSRIRQRHWQGTGRLWWQCLRVAPGATLAITVKELLRPFVGRSPEQ